MQQQQAKACTRPVPVCPHPGKPSPFFLFRGLLHLFAGYKVFTEPESGETPDPEEKDDVSKEPSAKGTEKTPREASLGDTASLHTRIREQQMEEHERSLTKKEKALFAPFVPTKKAMRQLVRAMDQISLSAYTGNMIVTGAPGSDMMKFTQNVIRRQQSCDGNFSGKVAKISAELLNHRKADAIVEKIPNGALIVAGIAAFIILILIACSAFRNHARSKRRQAIMRHRRENRKEIIDFDRYTDPY